MSDLAPGSSEGRRRWRRLAATAIASVLAGPALAQDVGQLVTFRADNQAAAAARWWPS